LSLGIGVPHICIAFTESFVSNFFGTAEFSIPCVDQLLRVFRSGTLVSSKMEGIGYVFEWAGWTPLMILHSCFL